MMMMMMLTKMRRRRRVNDVCKDEKAGDDVDRTRPSPWDLP
jgi:hypothetical protein